jgi:GAF domain-containing protein
VLDGVTALDREERLARTFVDLADSLAATFDVLDFLHLLTKRLVEVLDVSAASVVLIDPAKELQLVAASEERARLLEMIGLQHSDGPSLDAHRTGTAITVALGSDRPGWPTLWPTFTQEARRLGYGGVGAVPMSRYERRLGALNLFLAEDAPATDRDMATAQAMADVATIAILQQQTQREAQVLSQQLQHALDSRVTIEQAKGILAERTGLSIQQAFENLRHYARSHNRRIIDVAGDVIHARLDSTDVLGTT